MNYSMSNTEQRDYWNEIAGPKWVQEQEQLDRQIENMGRAMLDHAGLESGDAVLDVGCGCGATALEAARRVGPTGRVLGADLSSPMLDRARERARTGGLEHVEFIQADAQRHAFLSGSFDAAISRFGVMFFDDPVAAFANIRSALKPGKQFTFACWRSLTENPWMLIPVMAAAPILELQPSADPNAPGPFSLADESRLRDILDSAGFSTIEIEAHDDSVTIGGAVKIEDAVDFFFRIGPLAQPLADATPKQRDETRNALTEALREHAGDNGVTLPGATWIVSARNPS